MSTTIETPWGPFRNFGSSGAYVLDPRTWSMRPLRHAGLRQSLVLRLRRVGPGHLRRRHECRAALGHAPLRQAVRRPQGDERGVRHRGNAAGRGQRVPPHAAVSRRRPGPVHLRLRHQHERHAALADSRTTAPASRGSGCGTIRATRKTAFDLIKSSDKHFRPVDPQIGPDGALWFGDWANPLIGHMQYSQRDPNRDHIARPHLPSRATRRSRLLAPDTQAGRPIDEVLEQLKAAEWRTRYRVRADLQARPRDEVLAAATAWLGTIGSDPDCRPPPHARCSGSSRVFMPSMRACSRACSSRRYARRPGGGHAGARRRARPRRRRRLAARRPRPPTPIRASAARPCAA